MIAGTEQDNYPTSPYGPGPSAGCRKGRVIFWGSTEVTMEDVHYLLRLHRSHFPAWLLAAMAQLRRKWLICGTKQNWPCWKETLPGSDSLSSGLPVPLHTRLKALPWPPMCLQNPQIGTDYSAWVKSSWKIASESRTGSCPCNKRQGTMIEAQTDMWDVPLASLFLFLSKRLGFFQGMTFPWRLKWRDFWSLKWQ